MIGTRAGRLTAWMSIIDFVNRLDGLCVGNSLDAVSGGWNPDHRSEEEHKLADVILARENYAIFHVALPIDIRKQNPVVLQFADDRIHHGRHRRGVSRLLPDPDTWVPNPTGRRGPRRRPG